MKPSWKALTLADSLHYGRTPALTHLTPTLNWRCPKCRNIYKPMQKRHHQHL